MGKPARAHAAATAPAKSAKIFRFPAKASASISALIAAHKRAVVAAAKAETIVSAFPSEVSDLAQVEYGQFHTHDNGVPVKQPLYAYSHEDLDVQLSGHGNLYKEMGGVVYQQFQTKAAALHAELDKALEEKKALRNSSGYAKADRLATRRANAAWRALYALTAVSPSSLKDAAAMSAYMALLDRREKLNHYMRRRFLKALARAA